jgi:transposase
MRIAPVIKLSDDQRDELKRLLNSGKTPIRVVERAQIVLLAAKGLENRDIAASLGIARGTAGKWRTRFAERGLPGIEQDAYRSGRPPRISRTAVARIVGKTTGGTPEAQTHWSRATMSKAVGVSESSVGRIWRKHGLKPHLFRSFKLSRDPKFVEKLEDIVGLYLNPPENAIVLAVDEKSQIQALDRTQPGLPIKRGRLGTMTHDYKRNGTATLFAALNILSGKVISACMPRHRNREWLKFLRIIDKETPPDQDLHLIADNYSTHKHPNVRRWLAAHPRFHMHFTPTSASWLNMVERFFRELTEKAIRRGRFASVYELVDAIYMYIDKHNTNSGPFIWTAKAADILAKVTKARRKLETITHL